MNAKPQWLLYAEQVRKDMDNLKPQKSGKNAEQKLLRTWKTATAEKQYPGSLSDWEILIHRLGRRRVSDTLSSVGFVEL
jgi:hypothetical protein